MIFEPRRDKTNNVVVRSAQTKTSLSIRPVWPDSLLHVSAQKQAEDLNYPHADSEGSDQAGRMPRLIWVCDGRTTILLFFSRRGSFISIASNEIHTMLMLGLSGWGKVKWTVVCPKTFHELLFFSS